jgi:hypothetical protein
MCMPQFSWRTPMYSMSFASYSASYISSVLDPISPKTLVTPAARSASTAATPQRMFLLAILLSPAFTCSALPDWRR